MSTNTQDEHRLVERLVADGESVRAFVRYTSTGTAGWLDSLEPDTRAAN